MSKGIALIAGIFSIGIFFFSYPVWTLMLTENGRVIFYTSIKPGNTFQLAYLHSIALSDVEELFCIDANYRIVLTETRFQGQGTGFPYNPNPREELLREGNWFRLTGMQRTLPSIAWRVQAQWRNRFRFGNHSETDFSANLGDGLILIQVQKINIASYLRMALCTKNL